METTMTPEVKAEEPKVEVTPPEKVVGDKPKDDLVTRVSQVKDEPKVEVKEPEFDFKEIESIPDPKAKEYAEKAYKSFQRGFNQKFQEIAELRKSLDNEKQTLSNWSPERVQALLNNPEFVKAAQTVAQTQNPSNSGLTDQEWSALSDGEKKKMQAMETEIHQLKQQNWVAQMKQEDESLRSKYANYKPEAVDIITNDILTGKVRANREDLWKVYDYDSAVRRAYELGKQDKQTDTTEKINASSIEGSQVTAQREIPAVEKGESNRDYFHRLMLNNLTKQKK